MKKAMMLIIFMPALYSVGRAYTISGTVIDRDTMAPLENMRVSCWNQDLEEYTEDWTLADGSYVLTMNAGFCDLAVLSESVYARIGRRIELTADLEGQDFSLFPEAVLSGRLVDYDTAEPLGFQEIFYWSDEYIVWKAAYTDGEGRFELRALPPGIAEVQAQMNQSGGYSAHLPRQFRMASMAEGEVRDDVWMFARRGALVTGQLVDVNSDPIAGIYVDIIGNNGDAWLETNLNGEFQARIPPGIYVIQPAWDEDEDDPIAAIPVILEIENLSPVSVPPMTCYTDVTGGQISGMVNLTPGGINTGYLGIAAFPAGAVITPSEFNVANPAIFLPVDPDGPFTIPALPPGSYDLYLIQFSEIMDEVESYAILGKAMDAAVGTTDAVLSNDPGTITVTGTLENPYGTPILLAEVFLEHASGPEPRLAAFAGTDPDGSFTLYNVRPGDYIFSILHPRYAPAPVPITISGSGMVDIGVRTTDFSGVTEAADMNGDGLVALEDIATAAEQWLGSGSADLDQSDTVDLEDLGRMTQLWMYKALWLNE